MKLWTEDYIEGDDSCCGELMYSTYEMQGNDKVRIRLNNDTYIEVRIIYNVINDKVGITVRKSEGSIMIKPEYSNSVNIEADKD